MPVSLNEVRIAVAITAPHWAAALVEIAEAARQADLVEIRLDCLQDRDLYQHTEEILRQACAASSRPLIFTHRSGQRESASSTAEHLKQLINRRQPPFAQDYFDFDLNADNTIGLHFYNTYLRLFDRYPQIILSHHDFNSCVERELISIYHRLAAFAPDVVKVAAQADRVGDVLTIFKLLEIAGTEHMPIIALAMGEAGRISRILAPSLGGFLTFAAFKRGAESAPGQFSLNELLSLYHIKSITKETMVCALLGNPVGHSVSPHIHNAAFADLGLDAVYLPIALTGEELPDFLTGFLRRSSRLIQWQFRGASVTVPHKVAIMPLLDEIDISAEQVGAVNTIVCAGERLRGYNTDVVGALAPLAGHIELDGARVAVLGSGGAARAVVAGLKAERADITVYGRDSTRLAYFAERFDVKCRPFIEAIKLPCDLLVNTTPIGMQGWSGEQEMPISADLLSHCGLVYDLIYNPPQTPLLRAAQAAGVPVLGGLEMLIAQAVEQFRLWMGVVPSIEVMRSAAIRKLNQ
ncbi:MAG: shikimate dehydrogenase [Acidobacteriota bacterium]